MTPERQYALVVGAGLVVFAAAVALGASALLAGAVAVAAAVATNLLASREGPADALAEHARSLAAGAAVAVAAASLARAFDGSASVVAANAVAFGVAGVHLAEVPGVADADRDFVTAFAFTFPMVVLADLVSWPVFQLVLGYGLATYAVGNRDARFVATETCDEH